MIMVACEEGGEVNWEMVEKRQQNYLLFPIISSTSYLKNDLVTTRKPSKRKIGKADFTKNKNSCVSKDIIKKVLK